MNKARHNAVIESSKYLWLLQYILASENNYLGRFNRSIESCYILLDPETLIIAWIQLNITTWIDSVDTYPGKAFICLAVHVSVRVGG